MNRVIEYLESLDLRIKALESSAKNDASREAAQDSAIIALQAKIAELEAKIAELEARPIAAPTAPEEPEVEVELVFDEETEEVAPAETNEPETAAEEEPQIAPAQAVVAAPVEEAKAAPKEEVKAAPAEEAKAPVKEESPKEETPKTTLYGSPVKEIKQAISLGDRFLFLRELFNQNGEQMQRTLNDLDQLSSFDEALALIDQRFSWDKESKAYELFITVLHRRFS